MRLVLTPSGGLSMAWAIFIESLKAAINRRYVEIDLTGDAT